MDDGFIVMPVINVAIHIGMAIAIFIESCDVVVNVYGRSPSKLEIMMNISRLVKNRDHFCPTGESGWIILYNMFLINQLVIADIRFPNRFDLDWISINGKSIDIRLTGVSRISGLANCSNIFMFMVV